MPCPYILRALCVLCSYIFFPSYYYAYDFSQLAQIFIAERLRIPRPYLRATN
jgi:hypothetical protein